LITLVWLCSVSADQLQYLLQHASLQALLLLLLHVRLHLPVLLSFLQDAAAAVAHHVASAADPASLPLKVAAVHVLASAFQLPCRMLPLLWRTTWLLPLTLPACSSCWWAVMHK
jgi:hypothetical protein